MPRDKKISLNITQPIMVYNPVKLYQMHALYEIINKFSVIDQFSKRCFIWLLEHSERLTRPVFTRVPLATHRFICDDARRITDVWHLNLVLKCMDSFMKLYSPDPDPDCPDCIVQISVKSIQGPDNLELPFDPEKIALIAL